MSLRNHFVTDNKALQFDAINAGTTFFTDLSVKFSSRRFLKG